MPRWAELIPLMTRGTWRLDPLGDSAGGLAWTGQSELDATPSHDACCGEGREEREVCQAPALGNQGLGWD